MQNKPHDRSPENARRLATQPERPQPPVKEPPNEPTPPPVEEPEKTPPAPPPPQHPPVKEPPGKPQPPVKEPPPDPDRQPPHLPPDKRAAGRLRTALLPTTGAGMEETPFPPAGPGAAAAAGTCTAS